MIELKESKTRDIPIWLTALVLILSIGGGTALIWWYMKKDDQRQVVEIPEDKSIPAGKQFKGLMNGGGGNNGRNAMFTRGQTDLNVDGIHEYGRSGFNYRVKIGNTLMNVTYSNANRFEVVPQYSSLREPEQIEMTSMRLSMLADATWRETLQITDAQLEKLRKVPAPQNMPIEPAEKAKLVELWKAYHDGPAPAKPDAEKALLATLDQIGKAHLDAAKKFEADRAAAIRAVFTPEQLQKYHDAGGARPAPKANK